MVSSVSLSERFVARTLSDTKVVRATMRSLIHRCLLSTESPRCPTSLRPCFPNSLVQWRALETVPAAFPWRSSDWG